MARKSIFKTSYFGESRLFTRANWWLGTILYNVQVNGEKPLFQAGLRKPGKLGSGVPGSSGPVQAIVPAYTLYQYTVL